MRRAGLADEARLLLRTPAGAAEDAGSVLDRVADQLRFILRHYPGPLVLGTTAIEESVRLGLQHALALIEAERALVMAAQDAQQARK